MNKATRFGLVFTLCLLLVPFAPVAADDEGIRASSALAMLSTAEGGADAGGHDYGSVRVLDSIRLFGNIQTLATIREKSDWYGPDEIPNEKSGFRIHRARFGITGDLTSGKLFDDITYSLGYYFQVASGREADPTDDLDAEVIDAYGWASFDLGEKFSFLDPIDVSVGAGKLDFNREQMRSSRSLHFILRPWVVESLAPDRDVGISIGSGLKDGLFRYSFGVYNGRAENNEAIFRGDDNDKVMFVGRLEANPLGPICCDFDDEFKVSLGAGIFYNEPLEAEVTGYNVDARVSVWRVWLEGGYIKVTIEPDIVGQVAPVVREEIEKDGYYAQAGIFVWPGRIEVVGRYEDYEDNLQPEYTKDLHYFTFGLNWFFKGNHLNKLQLSYIVRDEDDWGSGDMADIDNNAFMAQLQLGF